MIDPVTELAAIVELLDGEGIEYALCGGLAVNVHGHSRFTADIDLLVLPEDVEQITAAVRSLGFSLTTRAMPFGVGTEFAHEAHRITKLGDEAPLCLDLLVVAPFLEPVWRDRQRYEWAGRALTVVSREGLAIMKRAAGRAKDLNDLEELGLSLEVESK